MVGNEGDPEDYISTISCHGWKVWWRLLSPDALNQFSTTEVSNTYSFMDVSLCTSLIQKRGLSSFPLKSIIKSDPKASKKEKGRILPGPYLCVVGCGYLNVACAKLPVCRA